VPTYGDAAVTWLRYSAFTHRLGRAPVAIGVIRLEDPTLGLAAAEQSVLAVLAAREPAAARPVANLAHRHVEQFSHLVRAHDLRAGESMPLEGR
jgi:hypothetical protein